MKIKKPTADELADLTMTVFKDASIAAMKAADPDNKGMRPEQVQAVIIGILIGAYTLHKTCEKNNMPGLRPISDMLDAADASATMIALETAGALIVEDNRE